MQTTPQLFSLNHRQATGGNWPLQDIHVPTFEVPDHQTVSSGLVVQLLARYVHSGCWTRVTTYYALDDHHRARDFSDEHGQVWSACEVLCETHRGWRVRLVLAPVGCLSQRLKETQQDQGLPLACARMGNVG